MSRIKVDDWSLVDYIDLDPKTKSWLEYQSPETQLFIIKELRKMSIFRKIRIIIHGLFHGWSVN